MSEGEIKLSTGVKVNKQEQELCLQLVSDTLKYNKTAQKLVDSIQGLGCKIPSNFFVCRSCDSAEISGGFSIPVKGEPYSPQIVVCQDKQLNKNQVANTIVHELVHAYDFCRSNIEVTNCYQRACTEIRASSLSDECSLSMEALRGNFQLKGGHGSCVQRRAQRSLEVDPICREKAAMYVNSVFKECNGDKSPFEHL
jgi:inner membrane protease ATP23